MLFDAQMEQVYLAPPSRMGRSPISAVSGRPAKRAPRNSSTRCATAFPRWSPRASSTSRRRPSSPTGANVLAIRAVATSIRSTVDNGNPLIFKEDGPLMAACAGIRKCTGDINDCAKIWGVEVALSASSARDLPKGLDPAQSRAMAKIVEMREGQRRAARRRSRTRWSAPSWSAAARRCPRQRQSQRGVRRAPEDLHGPRHFKRRPGVP